jgi:hypothetical protein
MLSSNPSEKSKKAFKVIGRKLLHTVIKVKNLIFLALCQFFADNFFSHEQKKILLIILAYIKNCGVKRGRNG